MRIHFDLEGIPPYFRARWDTRLAEWFSASPGAVTSVATPDEADAILVLGRVRHWGQVRKAGLDDVHPHKTFAWDSSDFPSGRIAGLYAGLPRELYEPNRHRTFCYPFRWNELVAEYPQAEATQLAGFLGAITSPLRSRLREKIGGETDFSVSVAESIWHRMDDPASRDIKKTYCNHLRGCRFILCPRGNGVSSVRLFETMEAGRVPVILADRFVPPADPAWRDCVIHVPEKDLPHLPAILREADRDWPAMARRARAYWESNYSDATLLPRLVRLLGELQASAGPPGWRHHLKFTRYALRHLSRDASRLIHRLSAKT